MEKFTKEHDERIAARINDLESDLNTTIRVEKDTMKRKFEMDVSKLEKQIDLIHTSHIHDIQSMKGIHRQFNKASEQFDQKLSIVVDLEKAYQQLLMHMKNTSQVVDQMIQLNLLVSTENSSTVNNQAVVVDSTHREETSYSPKASS